MLSGILRSETAVEVNIRIMRAFTKMRHFISNNASIFHRLETMEYHQLDMQQHLQTTDKRLDEVVYHVGASIKDLGKKWFGFSKMELLSPEELVERINRG